MVKIVCNRLQFTIQNAVHALSLTRPLIGTPFSVPSIPGRFPDASVVCVAPPCDLGESTVHCFEFEEGKRIGKRSDSKSDAGQPVAGSSPVSSALCLFYTSRRVSVRAIFYRSTLYLQAHNGVSNASGIFYLPPDPLGGRGKGSFIEK